VWGVPGQPPACGHKVLRPQVVCGLLQEGVGAGGGDQQLPLLPREVGGVRVFGLAAGVTGEDLTGSDRRI
jgi:hypothetical protein